MALPPSLDESERAGSDRHKVVFTILRVGIALVVATLILQIKLDFLESWLYDLRVRFRPAPPVSGQIEIISIDRPSAERLKGSPELKDHTILLEKLGLASPRAVVYAVNLTELKGDLSVRQKFAATSATLPQFYVLTEELLEMKGGSSQLRMPAPLENIHVVAGPISKDSNNFARDGVTRRFLVDYEGILPIHVLLAQQINPEIKDVSRIRGLFQFLDVQQAYINFRPTGSYPTTSFADLIEGRVSPDRFRGKIVLVGYDTQVSEKDYALTPYSRESVAMTAAEVHANVIDTLIRNDSPVRAPSWVDFIFVAAISIITMWVVFLAKPARGLLVLGSTLLIFTALAGFAFWPFGFWVSMAHPLLAVFLCYYFLIPYRLIIENRRSWEIYQKHRLLQQVEELKTNFISMMSHDLKTPIARILGMTDIIRRDATALSEQQTEAIETIRHSSDDLLKFINSILQYGKIEAQQIQLHLQPKDINSLLRDVIQKHEFMARLKKTQILAELEPLFPIPVDPELIKQVFSNLIENAIKYSPEDTKILVSTEEQGGFVVIQIADQGAGIPADELPHVFMKFFRSKNAKSSPIKGSGLGLYLANYFTELHRGRISVESTYGQGSTFTVELPLEQSIEKPEDPSRPRG